MAFERDVAMRRSRRFLFTMSNSAVFFVPAARCCARVLLVSFPSGRAERRKAQYFCCRAFRRATDHAWRGAARVQRDALASRRSTVAILGRGPRFLLRH